MKILNMEDLLDVASDELPEDVFKWFEGAFESLTQLMALTIAQKLNVELASDAANEPGFGGLCVGFKTGPNGEQPDCIDDKDKWGEWDE